MQQSMTDNLQFTKLSQAKRVKSYGSISKVIYFANEKHEDHQSRKQSCLYVIDYWQLNVKSADRLRIHWMQYFSPYFCEPCQCAYVQNSVYFPMNEASHKPQ